MEISKASAAAQAVDDQCREDMRILRLSKTLRWVATLALISVGVLLWYVFHLYS